MLFGSFFVVRERAAVCTFHITNTFLKAESASQKLPCCPISSLRNLIALGLDYMFSKFRGIILLMPENKKTSL